jgi:N-acetylneuraminic acid mutarotase
LSTLRVLRAFLCVALWLAGFSFSSLAQTAVANEWTWIGGSSTVPACAYGPPYCGQNGVYGTVLTAAAGNFPGARTGAVRWTDHQGNLWLFGGSGFGANNDGLLNDLWEFNQALGEWVWISGSNEANSNQDQGVYGTLGVAAAGNTPGDRLGAAGWVDSSGDLWLFGGQGGQANGQSATLNDLWKFDVSSHLWTWMSGNDTETTQVDGGAGQPGVYGRLGVPAAGNVPGSRGQGMAWTDKSGNFWLFGGNGYASNGPGGPLNDLWEFSLSTGQWTWMGGSNMDFSSGGGYGVYGTPGTPAAGNIPGDRMNSYTWTDAAGNFWLFGGEGVGAGGDGGTLNDVWKFNPLTNQWTWMKGQSTIPAQPVGTYSGVPVGPEGVYGMLAVAATANTPGGREGGVTWVDRAGNLWLSGGEGSDGKGDSGGLNDIWVFNPVDDEWAWMGGSDTALPNSGYAGLYGTLGRASAGNLPGTRTGAIGWSNTSGDFLLFGGEGDDSTGTQGLLNDLWSYAPAAPSFPAGFALSAAPNTLTMAVPEVGGSSTSTLSTVVTGGFNAAINLAATGQPSGITVSFSPSSISGAGTSTMTMTIDSEVPSGTYNLTVTGTGGGLTVSTPITLTTTGTPAPTFSPVAGNYTTAQTVTISDANPAATIYYTTDESTPTANSNVYTGPITVSTAENVQAIAIANGYANSAIGTAYYTIGASTGLGEWTWMGGYTSVDGNGSYGTLGTAWGGNLPPARSGAASWRDANGNLWIFGGTNELSNIQAFNDLWFFNTATNVWTWMGGSSMASNCGSIYGCGVAGVYGVLGTPATGNIPGARSAASTWVDGAGHLWLFGGYGYDANDQEMPMNDLWMFDPSSKAWTWVSGSSDQGVERNTTGSKPGVYGALGVAAARNTPGSRYGASTWVDSSGNLWLFGGEGSDEFDPNVELNDMWKFNPSTTLWTWMGGSNLVPVLQGYKSGVYGTLGVPAAANIPDSRYQAASWTDSSGNFWLFGGNGLGGLEAKYNDLWKFNPATNQWAWMSGSNQITCGARSTSTGLFRGNFCGQISVTGTLGVASASNMPGGRTPGASWVDSSGNFWVFGGTGLDNVGQYIGPTSDLWRFNPSTTQWTWMGGLPLTSACGSDGINCEGDLGIYGLLGVAGAGDAPGSRTTAVGWTDTSGNLWLFSGWGQASFFLSNVENNAMNDVWKYEPPASTLPAAVTPAFSVAAGAFTPGGFVAIFNGMANATIHYTMDGSTPTITSPAYTGLISLVSSETINAIATAPGYLNSAVASAAYVIQNFAATPTFSIPGGPYTSSQTVTISDATPGVTLYYTTNGTTPSTSSSVYSGPITISSSGTLQAIAVETGYFTSLVAGATYSLNAATPVFSIPGGTFASSQTVTISDATPGVTLYYTTNGTMPSTSSPVYSGPITVSSSGTVQAIAVETGYFTSLVAQATYYLTAATPVFSIPDGTYTSAQTVTVTDATPGVTLYYTTNGIMPSTSSPVYSGPITISSTETLQAIAVETGYSTSFVAQATYYLNAATPTFSPSTGAYNSAQTVSISDATPGVTIYYTTNGTMPSTSSSVYSGPITVSSTETLEAIAVETGYSTSLVAKATYDFNVATPTFSVPGGTYTSAQTVTISDATSGSSIYYTTDGTTPTLSSSVYSTPITVSSSETVQAIAIVSGTSSSAVGSAVYVINLPAPDFSVVSSLPSMSLAAGQSASTTVSITSLNGFTSTVTFSCSGLPAGASCSFSPAAVIPSGGTATTTLTITTSPTTADLFWRYGNRFSGSTLAITLCIFGWRRRRRLQIHLQAATLLVALSLISGCGGGGAATTPPAPVASVVTVTATAGSLQHTTTFSLTLN